MIFSLFFYFKRRGRLRDPRKAGQNQGKGELQQYIPERNHILLLYKSQDSLKTLLITSWQRTMNFKMCLLTSES